VQRIAFIGLGAMGSGMASRLVDSGYDVAVYNRTRSKAEEVGRLGARVADTPADAARDVDVVMTSVANSAAVEDVLFGPDGALSTAPAGAFVADLSTVPPDFARELAERASAAGFHALDTCVLGNFQHARDGELRVMVGGDEGHYQTIEPVLQAIAKEVTYLGGNGLGATMKLVLNMLMGIEMQALAEAVVFGERAGLPRDRILEMIAPSGYSAPVMRFKCGVMQRRAFGKADFRLSLMRKDMMLVLQECQRLGVPMPASEASYSMLTAAAQRGLGDLDCSAILAFMEQVSGLSDYPWPGEGEPVGGPPAS
jgi:3-hydroxyisobutyrate dehydrogenase